MTMIIVYQLAEKYMQIYSNYIAIICINGEISQFEALLRVTFKRDETELWSF